MYWLTISYWRYLLAKPCSWKKFWCRVKCHPCGVVWYNIGGNEPDYHCKDCGDDLG